MSNVIVRMLEPEQFYLLEDFCKAEGIPMLSPDWSKVIAAIDVNAEKVVGVMVAQMQIHVEPIWISEGYRNGKVSKDMSDSLDGYLDGLAGASGQDIAVWCQPTNAAAEKICRSHGYVRDGRPLYTKVYSGEKLTELLAKGNAEITKE